jgi:hypothetical protein
MTNNEFRRDGKGIELRKKQGIGESSGLIRAGYAELKDYKRIANCPEMC